MAVRPDVNDAMIIAGAVLIVLGIGLLSIAAALIVAGVFLVLAGAARDLLHERH